ncbi:PAS domain S-box protein [Methyloversatilis thermotolerans]|uniref:PAS domain S-box protein n=1 Tax=Methyloversatilis thermotolerans TaxID=1346290 RepID=UPI00037274EF|nr:PAS domain S-box protein [Methyloversatilis thermotolerans]
MRRPVLPARTLVPLLLTVFALLVTLTNNALRLREYRSLVEHEQTSSLAERLGGMQAQLDEDISNRNLTRLRRSVAELGLRPYLTDVFLIAPGGLVLGTLDRAGIGRHVSELADGGLASALLEQPVPMDRSLNVTTSADGQSVYAVMTLVSGHRLYARSDLELPVAERLHASRGELQRDALFVLLSAFLLALFLHLFWFRRAQSLAEAARQVGEGRLDTRLDIGGRDELARIADAFNDMTIRLQAQHAALRDSEQRMRAVFEQAGVGVARVDAHTGRFVEVNAKYCEITGFTQSEMLQMDFVQLTHPDDVAADMAGREALRGGRQREFQIDKRLLHRDGHVVWVSLSVTPLWRPGAAPDFCIAVLQDITSRRLAEQALEHERNRLNAAERISGLGSWEYSPSTRRAWWSEQMFRLFHLEPGDEAPDEAGYLALIHPDDRDAVRTAVREMDAGQRISGPYLYRTAPDRGPVRYLRPTAAYETDDTGSVIHYAGTLLDVSHTVKAEQALRASEERLRATLEHAPNVAVQWFDREGRVLYWNHASSRLFGWSVDEAMGRRCDELMLDAAQAQVFVEHLRHLERERTAFGPAEYEVQHRSGRTLAVEASSFSIPAPDGARIFVFMAVDITARRHAERAAEQERTYLRTLFAALPDMVWVKSPDGHFMSCNPVFEQVLDIREADLVGKTDYDLVSPEQADSFRAHDQIAARGGLPDVTEEWLVSQASGERILLQTIKVPMRTSNGRLIGVLGIARNITDLKNAQEELRALNADLERRVAERTEALTSAMKELESFSYAVSHDLKAPLRGIDGYSKILLEDYGDVLDPQAVRFLGNIRAGTAQMHALIEDLLAYSRMERRALESQRVDLCELVQSVVSRRVDEIRAAAAQVIQQVPPLVVRADRQGLDLILRNLFDNALKFSRDAHPPVITISAAEQGSCIVLAIRDNGIGFDMKYHERIFEIFQRLHRVEEFSGTGVGLALVRKAMQRMGGRVWADSTPGEGACFYLEFPA